MKKVIIKKVFEYAVPVLSAIGTLSAAIADQKKTEKVDKLIKEVEQLTKK